MRSSVLFVLLLPLTATAQLPEAPITPLTQRLIMEQPHPGMDDATWLKMVTNPANRFAYAIKIYEDMLDTMQVDQLDRRFFYTLMPRRSQAHGVEVNPEEQRSIRGSVPHTGAHGPHAPDEVGMCGDAVRNLVGP